MGNALTLARHRTLAAVSLLLALLGTMVVATGTSGAQEDPGAESDQVRDRQALVAVDVDVLTAEGDTVVAAIGDLDDAVEAQKHMLSDADLANAAAQADLNVAEAALADTQARLTEITTQADAIVIDAFMNPPSDSALDALTAESLEDATVKQAFLNMQADANAELLGQYEALLDQLEVEKAAREEAADAAAAAQAEAEAAYEDVQATVGEEARFAVEVQRRLDHRLAEADALQETDPALAEQIRAREAQIAEALNALDEEVLAERARARAAELAEEADANRNISGIKPVPGGVVEVACPAGGVIEIAGDIAPQVQRLLGDAADAGISMCGYGYRDPADQIRVRRENCGTSNYAIYQAPSSACSPPTARPGQSMHEQGLAIDFSVGGRTISSTSAAYRWLKANASNYGLYNLPGEAWHWSVDGN
jgi:peptidoglycan hydrolase CwlO-like protein